MNIQVHGHFHVVSHNINAQRTELINIFGFGFFRSHTAFSTKDPETRASTSQIRDYANIHKRLYHSYSYQFNSMRV